MFTINESTQWANSILKNVMSLSCFLLNELAMSVSIFKNEKKEAHAHQV